MGAAGQVVGRFAPSPTGRMHAGNVFAALMSWLVVKAQGGKIVLRIEDLDVERSRREHADQAMRDFESLGLTWDEGPFYQQGRDDAYTGALEALAAAGTLYPCYCTRAERRAASAPHWGEKAVYPGICRGLSADEAARRFPGRAPATRLLVPDADYAVDDLVQGRFSQNLARDCGDFIVRRSDGLFAYQLASVVDDAAQGVNCIVRGVDLLVSTPQQRYLQELLGYGPCAYAHVPLLVAQEGRRLAKRDRDAGLAELVARFGSPGGVVGHIAWLAGLAPEDAPATPGELLGSFTLESLPSVFPDKVQVIWK